MEISIKELATFSAPGPYRILAVLLKKCVGALKTLLTMLWKALITKGIIPEGLKVGLMTPIHKGGPRDRPQNYRSVTTSYVIKVFKKVVVKRLVWYKGEADLYNNRQHGGSCLPQLLEHHNRLVAQWRRELAWTWYT
jgi:hypothetical protein